MSRLRALWRTLEMVPWPCAYCHLANETPMVLWPSLRFHLICRDCTSMQNYPVHIKPLDPLAK